MNQHSPFELDLLGRSKLVKKNGEVMLTGKAYNNRVLTQYLAEKLCTVHAGIPNPADDRLALAFLCLNLSNGSNFLTMNLFACFPPSFQFMIHNTLMPDLASPTI